MQGEGLREKARPETLGAPGRGSSGALELLRAWKLPSGRGEAPSPGSPCTALIVSPACRNRGLDKGDLNTGGKAGGEVKPTGKKKIGGF